MSDSTATAREPSMEDILASIRRIIDEEDSRDGRPAADLDVESTEEMRDASPIPVMSAASVNRDEGAVSDSDGWGDRDDSMIDDLAEATDIDDESIFPERESPFWSRATGRDQDAQDDLAQEMAALDNAADDDGRPMTRSDIFTRAQNKLGSTGRPSARERMQSLAARAEQRANEADFADMPDLPDGNSTDYHASDLDSVATSPGHEADNAVPPSSDDGASGIDVSNVLDLTNPVDGAEVAQAALIARASDAMDRGEEQSETKAVETDADIVTLPVNASDNAPVSDDETAATDTPGEVESDVLDLTVPVETGAVSEDVDRLENGDSFNVSSVDTTNVVDSADSADMTDTVDDRPSNGADADEIEDVISQNLVSDDVLPDADTEHEGQDMGESQPPAADIDAPAPQDAPEPEDRVSGKTYSRFDSDDARVEPAPESSRSETADDYSAAFMMLDDQPSEPVASASESHDESLDAFAPDEEDGELDDQLGFSDTFGASDVYHDDPPVLDEDYSRSFGAVDDPISAEAAYAAESTAQDGDMEMVGGMVRDAMERDPVDYADPAALVSMTSEEISARALASLADVEGEASRRVYGSLRISEDGTSESLEGMVRGMLRPMLREWLDDNLPTMVESAVRGEVERISAKSRKYSRAAEKD